MAVRFKRRRKYTVRYVHAGPQHKMRGTTKTIKAIDAGAAMLTAQRERPGTMIVGDVREHRRIKGRRRVGVGVLLLLFFYVGGWFSKQEPRVQPIRQLPPEVATAPDHWHAVHDTIIVSIMTGLVSPEFIAEDDPRWNCEIHGDKSCTRYARVRIF